MHLISPLVSGIAGAENGSVSIYRRGTSTRATYYTDFEGTTAVTPTAAIALDANGGKVVYVNEPVNCIVYGSSATVVRTFVAGDGSPSVEVISQSFTGTDYSSGASGASEPATLAAVLDLWKTNAGAIDWKVLFGGAATTLQSAFTGLSGLVFNVKSSLYGATGDGVTDDTSSIAAAITAAQVAGGIVWFPPGTYRITSALTIGSKVSLAGAGASASYLFMDHASNDAIVYASTTAKDWQYIHGLRIGNAQTNSGTLVASDANVKLRVDECYIGDTNTLYGLIADTSASQIVLVTNSTVQTGNNFGICLGSAAGRLVAINVAFAIPATFNGSVVYSNDAGAIAAFCTWANANTTAGTFSCFNVAGGTGLNAVFGCDMPNAGGATCRGIYATVANNIYEYGNKFGTTVAAYSITGSGATATRDGIVLGSRDTREVAYDSDVSLTAACDQYGVVRVKRAAGYAAATTLTITAPISPGHRCALVYHNSNGGGATGLVTVTTVKGLANFTVNASSASVYPLVSVDVNGALVWALEGAVNFTP